MNDTPSAPRNAILCREVIEEARSLVAAGKNARFTCENKLQEQAVEERLKDNVDGYKSRLYSGSEYDLACQVIEEAKRIVGMGVNACFGCKDPDADIKERRRAFNKWKRNNR